MTEITRNTPGVVLESALHLEGRWLHVSCTAALGAAWGFACSTLYEQKTKDYYKPINADSEEYEVLVSDVLVLVNEVEQRALKELSDDIVRKVFDAEQIQQLLGKLG